MCARARAECVCACLRVRAVFLCGCVCVRALCVRVRRLRVDCVCVRVSVRVPMLCLCACLAVALYERWRSVRLLSYMLAQTTHMLAGTEYTGAALDALRFFLPCERALCRACYSIERLIAKCQWMPQPWEQFWRLCQHREQ